MITKSKVFQTVKKKIEDEMLIEEGDHIVLGLSGGADSMCLFSILLEMKNEMKFDITAVHVNHMIRGEEADEDQRFVESICEKTKVKCVSYKIDCKEWATNYKISVEEAGREIRYNAYKDTSMEIIRKSLMFCNVKIVTAHNLDDQAETIMMKLIRGASIDGIAGIDYIRNIDSKIQLVRPLLCVEKHEILSFCDENKVPYKHDKTNDESDYTRNKVRLELIPFIKENFNKNFARALSNNMESVKKDREYIWARMEEDFKALLVEARPGEIFLDRQKLANTNKAVRTRIIIKAFHVLNLRKNIGQVHIHNLDEKILDSTWTGLVQFPNGYMGEVLGRKVRLYNENMFDKKKNSQSLNKKDKPRIAVMTSKLDTYEYKENEIALDYDLFIEENSTIKESVRQLSVRTRESGDYIYMKNAEGRKKIQDIFVDQKVPREERDNIWMVALGKEIIWIPKCIIRERVTGKYKLSEKTQKVLILKVKNEEQEG